MQKLQLHQQWAAWVQVFLLLVVISSAVIAPSVRASDADGAEGAADVAAAGQKTILGKLEQRRNPATDRAGYSIVDRRSGVRYTVFFRDDLSEYVDQQVRIRGAVKHRPDGQAGFVRATEVARVDRSVRPAQNVEELPLEGPLVIEPGTITSDGDSLMESNEFVPSDSGEVFEGDGWGTGGLPASGWSWIRVEYLRWFTDGMNLPALVTTSPAGTARANAGVLGLPTTTTLFGNDDILDGGRNGLRARLGGYLDWSQAIGIEGEYFGFEDESLAFAAASNSNGTPILARPFFNINPRDSATQAVVPPHEDAELVSFPGVLSGTVGVSASSALHSAGARLLLNMCCQNYCNPCGPACRHFRRVDLVLGYRYFRLRDKLGIREDLLTLEGTNQTFAIDDVFLTQNDFHGGELGILWQAQHHRWTLEMNGQVALGNVQQVVAIDGSTVITQVNGNSTRSTGGLLAQRSNIGRHTRGDFAVIPQLGGTLGFHLTPRLRATAGYNVIYWSRVVRAGDQISLDVNPDLLPPEAVPFTGPLRPAFAFRDSDYWAHGLNAGLDFRW